MIETPARVVAVEPGFAWVEAERRAACDGCAAKSGCGTSAVSKVFGNRVSRVRAIDAIGVRPGEEVVVGLGEETLLRASLMVYMLPIAGLAGGAFIASLLFPRAGEPAIILAAFAGLLLGFFALRRRARAVADDPAFQPVVLRRQ